MSGYPGIFNAVTVYLMATNSGGGTGPTNRTRLQNAINDALASPNQNGAIVLIPAFSGSVASPDFGYFPVDGPIYIPNTGNNAPLLICGTGIGTRLRQTNNVSGNLFVISDTANVTFQDLTIEYVRGQTLDGCAFGFTGGSGHKLFRVNVFSCRYPVIFDACTDVSISECLFSFDDSHLSTFSDLYAVWIKDGCDLVTIDRSLFRWTIGTADSVDGGVLIDDSSNVKVTDTQIEDFGTGVTIQGSNIRTTGVTFAGSRVAAYGTCVEINETVSGISFLDCHFQASGAFPGSGPSSPGIAVGVGAAANDLVDTIRFVSCSLTGNTDVSDAASYGMQIGAAQNVQIIGGNYSGNGDTAGISIVGGATQVQIGGANCIGLEYEAQPSQTPLYQLYGILITWGSGIQILNVNCSGNGIPGTAGSGIYIDGSTPEQPVTDVTIAGVTCTGPLFGNDSIEQANGIYAASVHGLIIKGCSLSGSLTSPGYGIYLDSVTDVVIAGSDLAGNTKGIDIQGGSTTRVFIRDCDLTGYAGLSDAISVFSSLTVVEITNCNGYNDRHGTLSTTPPSGSFSGISVQNYYGPTTFYVKNFTVTVDSNNTHLTSGAFRLVPGETASLSSAGVLGTFLMIGS
jgi:hypothetical protein